MMMILGVGGWAMYYIRDLCCVLWMERGLLPWCGFLLDVDSLLSVLWSVCVLDPVDGETRFAAILM